MAPVTRYTEHQYHLSGESVPVAQGVPTKCTASATGSSWVRKQMTGHIGHLREHQEGLHFLGHGHQPLSASRRPPLGRPSHGFWGRCHLSRLPVPLVLTAGTSFGWLAVPDGVTTHLTPEPLTQYPAFSHILRLLMNWHLRFYQSL